ncbi:MAG TPA: GNAT family N-acetyltransferase [Candidatus Limnocylindrales bacterium]|nr:GNAT family N-acetyltransferase [Candidatus Limnocylindrales bacterium]
MVTTRAIRRDQIEDWLAIGVDDPANERMADRILASWADGSGGPALTFVAQDEAGTPVGRLAFTYGPVASSMPDVHEALALGLWLPWDEREAVEIGRRLVVEGIGALPSSVIALDAYANPEYMTGSDVRRAVFEAAELPLFQEKEGFQWSPETSPPPPVEPRLTYRSVVEAGRDIYARTMSGCTEGSLDRQDRYYAALVGRDLWGPEMLNFLTDDDADGWLLGYDSGGDVAGYVAIGGFGDETRGTIIHVGVLPEHRGNGYIVELLHAGNEASLRRRFATVVSDVDVENPPMMAAMERAGHHAAATRWHVHHYRLQLRR